MAQNDSEQRLENVVEAMNDALKTLRETLKLHQQQIDSILSMQRTNSDERQNLMDDLRSVTTEIRTTMKLMQDVIGESDEATEHLATVTVAMSKITDELQNALATMAMNEPSE